MKLLHINHLDWKFGKSFCMWKSKLKCGGLKKNLASQFKKTKLIGHCGAGMFCVQRVVGFISHSNGADIIWHFAKFSSPLLHALWSHRSQHSTSSPQFTMCFESLFIWLDRDHGGMVTSAFRGHLWLLEKTSFEGASCYKLERSLILSE